MKDFFWAAGMLVYFLQGVIALWGAFCTIMVWRRIATTHFVDEDEQDEFFAELEPQLAKRDFSSANALCEDDRRILPQLTLFAIANRDLGFAKLRHRLAERFQQDVMGDIEHRLSWIATVIKSEPMLGLLGTVMGMMGAFANLSSGEQVDASKMAEDIMFALITTAIGLAVSVPLILATASINIRLRKMEDLVGVGIARLFDSLKSVVGSH